MNHYVVNIMGGNWKSENGDGNTRRITRRGILASVSASAVGGLAGCSGGDGGNGGTSVPDIETPTDTENIIPGEIVHHELPGVEVLNHWSARTEGTPFVHLKIKNNRDEELSAPSQPARDNNPIIRARQLTEQGNQVGHDVWVGQVFGPSNINPGTSAEIGVLDGVGSDNAARYELCLYKKEVFRQLRNWERACTETDMSKMPGPGENDVVHDGVDDIEVTRNEMRDVDEGVGDLEIVVTLKNTGDQPISLGDFLIAVQYFSGEGKYIPEGYDPVTMDTASSEISPGETVTLAGVPITGGNPETYEVCLVPREKRENIADVCGWPRDEKSGEDG